EEHMKAKIHVPQVFTSSGGVLFNVITQQDYALTDTILCAHFSDDSCFVFSGMNNTNIQRADFEIFPNPSDGNFSLNWNSIQEEKITVSLFNANGDELKSIVLTSKSGANVSNISESELQAGIYFLKIQSSQNTAF